MITLEAYSCADSRAVEKFGDFIGCWFTWVLTFTHLPMKTLEAYSCAGTVAKSSIFIGSWVKGKAHVDSPLGENISTFRPL